MFCAAVASAFAMTASSAGGQEPARPLAGRVGVHEGVASCAGSTCHSRPVASGLVVRQNELITWQDPSSQAGLHSRAWRVLTESRGQAIANKLGLGPAQKAQACLGCHSDPAPASLRGARFQVSDGVGCEGCHGGAGGWIASHYVVGATHAANVAKGMKALEDPKVRAGVCLDCHLGSNKPGQFVTHQMMAAGHPRVNFELDLFSTLQQHYDQDADYRSRKAYAGGVKTWAVGQAMALDRVLTLFGEPARTAAVFPELNFFDCHACHRTISDDPKARLTAQANPGRGGQVGVVPFNDENMIMLAAAAKATSPGLAARLDADSKAFHTALGRDRGEAIRTGAKLAETSRALSSAFAARSFGKADTLAILDAVLSGENARRYTDYTGAAQAVMAADTLLNAMVASGQADRGAVARIRPSLDRAYREVRDPNSFNPDAFRQSMQQVAQGARSLR
jgi:hypothetical protein